MLDSSKGLNKRLEDENKKASCHRILRRQCHLQPHPITYHARHTLGPTATTMLKALQIRSIRTIHPLNRPNLFGLFSTLPIRAMTTSKPRLDSTGATVSLGAVPKESKISPNSLESQLSKIPRDTATLTVMDDTPTDAEWSQLSKHFTSIKDLTLDSGFDEDLNDNIPLQWPLQRLTFINACGERVQTPWVLEAKVKHLRLAFAMELRFGGPSSNELVKAQKERVERGEEQEIKTSNGITITFLPELAKTWFRDEYERRRKSNDEGCDESSSLETLEILENDVHDVLLRMGVSAPRVFSSLKTLHLRATNACDFYYCEDVLIQVLPQVQTLETLDLTLGLEYSDPTNLTELHKHLPPSLRTLRFRSTAELAKSETWPEWVRSFEDPKFLPQLERLSFLLDLHPKDSRQLEMQRKKHRKAQEAESENQESPSAPGCEVESQTNPANIEYAQASEGQKQTPGKTYKVGTDDLRRAKRACEEIWKAAGTRNIAVEAFVDDFPSHFPYQRPPDDRWEGL